MLRSGATEARAPSSPPDQTRHEAPSRFGRRAAVIDTECEHGSDSCRQSVLRFDLVRLLLLTLRCPLWTNDGTILKREHYAIEPSERKADKP